jgi:L-fucose isomerase-like protein
MTIPFKEQTVKPPLVGLVFLGRKRPGFDPEWGEKMKGEVCAFLEKQPYKTFTPVARAVDDATLREALDECRGKGCDTLLVLQPTMSDGRLASVLAQAWGRSVVLMATPENPVGEMISSCSLVGAHAFAATLRQLGRPFEIVYGGADWSETERQLRRAIPLAMLGASLSQSKMGLIGFHAPGFVDMHPDPFLMSKTFGIEMQHVGLVEFMDLVNSQPQDEVERDCAAMNAVRIPLKDIEATDLAVQSRYYLALRKLIEAESFASLAIRCWPELPNVVGHWPYLALSRLASEGYPVACEGDVDGALCCLLASRLELGPVYLTDWLEHTRDTITAWHGGMAPLQLCEPVESKTGPRLARHFNSKKPTVVDATLRVGLPVTAFRLWHCDGRYQIVAFEGETVAPLRHLLGTNGAVRVSGVDLFSAFPALCHQGMPHHLAVVEGHRAATLRAFARNYGVTFIEGK